MKRRVSIVLTTWNSAPYMPRCLAGIAGQDYPDLEVIAVDNASTDGTPDVVRATLPTAKQIVNDGNYGFTVAVNRGIAISTGEFVLLWNPDAWLAPDYVTRLVAAFDRAGDRFGMATGKLLHGEGPDITPTTLIDTKGVVMTKSGRHFDIGQGEVDGADLLAGIRPLDLDGSRLTVDGSQRTSANGPVNRQPSTVNPLFEVFGVSGAAAMYRRSFIDDVTIDGQFLDEDFFTYREDADVAWRGQVLGWRAMYVPAAVGYHVRTVTPRTRRQLSPVVNMHSVKNRFLLRLKNEGLYLALRHAPFELPRDLVAIAAILTVERTSLPALAWLWKNRRRIMAKRKAIQQRRRVPDRELAGWFV